MIKIVTGFRKDQAFPVGPEEAHKAYYLFFNPDARTMFANGVAIKGSDIDRIEPDYNAVMGWNATHSLNDDDMNEIRAEGVDARVHRLMALAGQVAKIGNEQDLNLPLSEVVKKYPQLMESKRDEGMKQLGQIQ